MRRIFLFTFLITLIKFSIADDYLLEKLSKLKTKGKISIETKNQQTNIGVKSKIIITDNNLFYEVRNTDSIGKLNISFPEGMYQIYTISNSYDIQVSNISIIKDSTSSIVISLIHTENSVLTIDTTKFYVSGFIVDKETNQPISLATILDKKGNTLGSTDSIGYFQFIPQVVNEIYLKKNKKSYRLKPMDLIVAKNNYNILTVKNYIPIIGLNTIKIFLLKGNDKQKIDFNGQLINK